MDNVAENHLMVKLNAIAELLPSNEKKAELFQVASSLMRVAVADGVRIGSFSAFACFGGVANGDSKKHMDEAGADAETWTHYLDQEASRYRSA